MMKTEVTDHGDAQVIKILNDRVDAAIAIQFKDHIRDLTEATVGRVIIDMSNVNFLDSSGLGAVVSMMKFLGPDRKLELAALTPTVIKVFRLTRMDTVITLHDVLEDAFSNDRTAA